MYNKIYKFLIGCGFCPVHKGFKLIIRAIIILCQSGKPLTLKSVYGTLSKQYNISAGSVCKNIMNAVNYASLKCDMDLYEKHFGILAGSGGISCGSFLYYVADIIKYSG